MSDEIRKVEIKKGLEIQVKAAREIDLGKPLYAINWFDLKRPRLYTVYNALVYSHLRKIGGAPVFKGYVKEVVRGDADLDRKMLLLVRYPSADAFLSMLSNRLFLMKSILRIKSVSRFIFGFSSAAGSGPEPITKPKKYTGQQHYLALILQESDEAFISSLNDSLEETDIEIFFSGTKAATLSRKQNDKIQDQPFFIDRLIMLSAPDYDHFDKMMTSDLWKKVLNDGSPLIYKLKRVL